MSEVYTLHVTTAESVQIIEIKPSKNLQFCWWQSSEECVIWKQLLRTRRSSAAGGDTWQVAAADRVMLLAWCACAMLKDGNALACPGWRRLPVATVRGRSRSPGVCCWKLQSHRLKRRRSLLPARACSLGSPSQTGLEASAAAAGVTGGWWWWAGFWGWRGVRDGGSGGGGRALGKRECVAQYSWFGHCNPREETISEGGVCENYIRCFDTRYTPYTTITTTTHCHGTAGVKTC